MDDTKSSVAAISALGISHEIKQKHLSTMDIFMLDNLSILRPGHYYLNGTFPIVFIQMSTLLTLHFVFSAV